MIINKLKKLKYPNDPTLFKFYMRRIQGYYGQFTFLIVLYGIIIVNKAFGVEWYTWIGLLLLSIPILLMFELNVTYPREIEYAYQMNKKIRKEFKELKEQNETIIRLLNK